MRKILLAFSIAILFSLKIKAQIISQPVDLVAFCCGDGDSLDIEGDGIYDIRVFAEWGFDSKSYFIEGLHPEILVTNAIDSGNSFGFYHEYHSIAGTQLLCWWYDLWKPQGGIKYSGFKRINAVNDTTCGWVKLDFLGDTATCEDTIVSFEIAYSAVPNQPIWAGQKVLITGISDNFFENDLQVYPTPASTTINLVNKSVNNLTINLTNCIGQSVHTNAVNQNSTVGIDVEALPNGVYYLSVFDGKSINNKSVLIQH